VGRMERIGWLERGSGKMSKRSKPFEYKGKKKTRHPRESLWRDGLSFSKWWRTRSLTPIRSPNQITSVNPVYSTRYHTSNPFNLPDSERNLILYIFPKQRTDVGSIPARIPDGVFFNSCLNFQYGADQPGCICDIYQQKSCSFETIYTSLTPSESKTDQKK